MTKFSELSKRVAQLRREVYKIDDKVQEKLVEMVKNGAVQEDDIWETRMALRADTEYKAKKAELKETIRQYEDCRKELIKRDGPARPIQATCVYDDDDRPTDHTMVI
jgi:hypothetical protein